MAFNDRLKEARLKIGMTQEQVADKIGVAKSTLTGYEKGNREPNMVTIQKLMEVLSVDANYLWQDEMQDSAEMVVSAHEWNIINKYRELDIYGKKTVDYLVNHEFERVQEQSMIKEERRDESEYAQDIMIHTLPLKPYVGGYGGAGLGVYLGENDNFSPQLIKVPEDMNDIDFVIGVNGDSMEPLYYNEDRVGIKKDVLVKEGDIGLFILNGDCFIKEFGGDKLISLNKKYEDIMLYEDDTMKCIGKVLGKI